MMIYVSSTCAGSSNILDAVERLANAGYRNIELSGGGVYVPDLEGRILALQKKLGLNLRCHNYFPPPEEGFVLNLASLDDVVYERTIRHFQKAINFSRTLGANLFGIHAGFFLDIKIVEMNGSIERKKLYPRIDCFNRFCEGYKRLVSMAGDVDLYVENNVIPLSNLKMFNGVNPLMLTSFADCLQLREMMNFKFLFDIGHLKVSAKSLGLVFQDECKQCLEQSDYIHISDNDGVVDQHKGIGDKSDILDVLKCNSVRGKALTLEICSDALDLSRSYRLLEDLL
jgi:sugar phosphate isomerase/epimerase